MWALDPTSGRRDKSGAEEERGGERREGNGRGEGKDVLVSSEAGGKVEKRRSQQQGLCHHLSFSLSLSPYLFLSPSLSPDAVLCLGFNSKQAGLFD